MILTMTDHIDGHRVSRYFDPITVNLVLGTDWTEDFVAGFSDMFGGQSETHQGRLEQMFSDANAALKSAATRLGANALLKVTYLPGEISGKNMHMLTLAASATPVEIVTDEEFGQLLETRRAEASAKKEAEVQRRETIESLQGDDAGGAFSQLLANEQAIKRATALRRSYGVAAAVHYLNGIITDMGLELPPFSTDDTTSLDALLGLPGK